MSADQLIVGCLAGAAALGAADAVAQGGPPPMRQVIGFTVTAVGLSVGSLFAPGLASGLAVLVLASSVFVYGAPLFDQLDTLVSPAAQAAKPGTLTTPTKPAPGKVLAA